MGKNFFDAWTIAHFICGFLSTSTLLPSYPIFSAIITNILHLIGELAEHYESPDGVVLETDINHLGDILFFFFGSILGVMYGTKLFINPKYKYIRYIILFILIIIYITELGRELFPYNWPFDSAFKPIN
jgi:hypothetical protein